MVFRNSNQEKSIQGIPFWEPTYFIGGKGKSSLRALKRQYLRVPRMVVMFMYHNCLRNPQSSISNHFWESGMFLKSHVLPLYFIPPPKKTTTANLDPKSLHVLLLPWYSILSEENGFPAFQFCCCFPKTTNSNLQQSNFQNPTDPMTNPIDMLSHPYNPWDLYIYPHLVDIDAELVGKYTNHMEGSAKT